MLRSAPSVNLAADDHDPDLTLICTTRGPVERVGRLVESVERARANLRIQLVVVDQSSADSRLDGAEVLTSPPGAARGRNAGLRRARGRIIAFPDDSVWYPDGTLEAICARLDAAPDLDGLLVRQTDTADGRRNVLRYPATTRIVDRMDLVWTGIASGIVLRRRLAVLLGDLAEDLGVGAGTRWGAGEELDYLIRAVDVGARLRYDPDVWVVHPEPELTREQERSKQRAYGRGIGQVLRRQHYPATYAAYLVGRRVVKTSMLTARGRIHDARVAATYGIGVAVGYASGPDGARAA